MTGKEIAEICANHESCSDCELESKYPVMCEKIMRDMSNGTPETIYEIIHKDYGGETHNDLAGIYSRVCNRRNHRNSFDGLLCGSRERQEGRGVKRKR